MQIPNLTTSDIVNALEALLPKLDEIQRGRHRSTKFDLLWEGHYFPPKVVLSHAIELGTGTPFPEKLFSGGEGHANLVLERLGFRIVTKNGGSLPLSLHHRYGRKDVYAIDGVEFSPQKRHLTLGLSPRFKDNGYCIFITINKEGLDPAHNYEDQLFGDRFEWATRRDRGEDHPDYIRLRESDCRVSLFARNNTREEFAYLGELKYQSHREFEDPETGKVQQRYSWKLKHLVPDELLEQLTLGQTRNNSKRAVRVANSRTKQSRSPSSFDEFKKAYSYAVDSSDRTIIPAHHNYQVRLQEYLLNRNVKAEMERDFIDVGFRHAGEHYIGEIKVTTHLTISQAFRAALGQVIVYAHSLFPELPKMIIFFDHRPEPRQIKIATKYSIGIVIDAGGQFVLLNPTAAPNSLQEVFSTG